MYDPNSIGTTTMMEAHNYCWNDLEHTNLARLSIAEEAEDYVDHLRWSGTDITQVYSQLTCSVTFFNSYSL